MFIIRSLADFAVELDGEGRDTAVWTGAGSYVLAANVEDLLVIGDATAAVGNDLDNDIHAIGFLDDDVVAANGAVSIDGAGGDDSIGGGSFADSLSGGTGDDFLDGVGAMARYDWGALILPALGSKVDSEVSQSGWRLFLSHGFVGRETR